MTKKRLNKAVNRGFRLAGNVLMRRAIARLIHIDDASLSNSGLTRNAIADFLTTPLRTDPYRFFRHRRAKDPAAQPIMEPHAGASIDGMNGHRQDVGNPDAFGANAGSAPLLPTAITMKPTLALRLRVLTACVLMGFGALTACSGSPFEGDAAAARHEPAGRCRVKPGGQLISAQVPHAQDCVLTRGVVLIEAQPAQHQLHARDGPFDDAA